MSIPTICRWIGYNEPIIGLNHPTLSDTLNRALRDLMTASGEDPDGITNGYAPFAHSHQAGQVFANTAGTFGGGGIYKFPTLLQLLASLSVPYDAGNYPRAANLNLTGAMSLVGFDCTGAARTATLPAVASVPGQTYTVFKIDVSANQLILAAQGGEFISGAASKNTATQWGKIQVISNGVIWIQTI